MVIPLLLIAPLNAMATPPGWYANFVQNAPMPIDVKIPSANIIIKSAIWYLNTTEHNYHIKGIFVNTVPRASSAGVSILFFDNATGTRLDTGGGFNYDAPPSGVVANKIIKYDFTTGYNASNSIEFKTIVGEMS